MACKGYHHSIWTRAFSQLGYERINFTRKDTVKTFSHYLRLFLFQPLVLLLLCHKSKGLVSIRGFSWDLNIFIIFWAKIAT